ncbi:MAG: glucosamine-6-phosphate deaminase [Spirochaetes bacterium RIFOXYC1_FULL_54_7]|nr:MAG: glucosamine-6-phosphate deaminase [Spirochaetes bacterium RIFOXYC1_FULL_54_7]
MRLIVLKDYQGVSDWAARYVARSIAEYNAEDKDRDFVLGLPTGSSPIGMYRRLVELHKAGSLSFSRVVTFNMDEYIGLPSDHPRSYHTFMNEQLFSLVDIDPAKANLPNGNAPDLEAECARYEAAIEASGGVDLFVGGVGSDGHLAFNMPGSSLASRTRVKTLTASTRQANARFFDGDPEAVPSTALTVGVGTIMAAREVLIIVSGQSKARALRHAVEEGVNHLWPLSCLQLHPSSILVCDEESTMELKAGTVQYFNEIEAVGA